MEDKIIELYLCGESIKGISNRTKKSFSTIYSILNKNNILLRRQDGVSLRKKHLIKLYIEEKKSIEEIALIKNTTPISIKKALSRHQLTNEILFEGNILLNRLTPIQEQLIYGSLLGDAFCEMHRGFGRIKFEHGHQQEEYCNFKFNLLKNFSITKPDLKFRYDKRTAKNYFYSSFKTISSPIFSDIHNKFYKNNKKIVTRDILSKLDDRGLAFWFMDDGFKYNDCGFILCTESFSESENMLIKTYFKEKWDIIGDIKDNRILIKDVNAIYFQKIIEPNITPLFKYKLL